MKRSLMEETGIMLLRHAFTVKSLTGSCFDIVARKETTILLIKVLEDANSITEEYAHAMKQISGYIEASAIILAEKAGSYLETGVVYSKFGVYALNLATFSESLSNDLPFITSTKAGLTASVIGRKLREKREEEGYSLGTLSRKVGVSKRMIAKYESGDADISVNKAYQLSRVFGREIFCRINIFQNSYGAAEKAKSEVARKYGELGFESADTKKVPFDVIAKKEKDIILTEVGDKTNPQLAPLKNLIEASTLVIFRKEKPKKVPALTKKEFLGFRNSREIIKFLKEFE